MTSDENDLRFVGGEEAVFDFPPKVKEKGDDFRIRCVSGEPRR
jgi:hypothetical protein